MPRQAQLTRSHAQLPSLRLHCCCQGNKLSGLREKKSSHSKYIFSNAGLEMCCMCSQYTARAYTGWSSEKECFSFYCKNRSFPVSLLSNIDRIKMKDRNESTIAVKFIFQRCFLKIKIESKVSSREQRLRQRTILSH